MSSFGADRLLLLVAILGTALLQRAHQVHVDGLPLRDRNIVYGLLRGQIAPLVLLLLILPAELARLRFAPGSRAAAAASPALGVVATFVLWLIRRRAYRVYELAADDDAQAARARRLQGRAAMAFAMSLVLWGGLVAYKLS